MLQIHNPPDGYRPKGTTAWCPYCGEEKTFGLEKMIRQAIGVQENPPGGAN